MSGAWEGRVALPPSPSWYGACLGDWDPAGRRFVYVAGGTLVVLQPGERCVAACLVPPRRGRYTAVQFLPGRGLGSLLVAARAGSHASPAEVHLWDALSGDLVRRVRLPKVPPPGGSLAESPSRRQSLSENPSRKSPGGVSRRIPLGRFLSEEGLSRRIPSGGSLAECPSGFVPPGLFLPKVLPTEL